MCKREKCKNHAHKEEVLKVQVKEEISIMIKTRAKRIKERLHSVNKNSNFDIAALFQQLYVEEKSASISKLK